MRSARAWSGHFILPRTRYDVVAIPPGLVEGHLGRNGSSAVKGRALEQCVVDLFGLVPGVTLHTRQVVDHDGVEEVDLFFINERHADGFHMLPAVLPVECKNWSVPLGPAPVAYFVDTVRHRSLSDGILVAACGVAGSRGRGALRLLDRALQEGVRIVVLTAADLLGLSTTHDLTALVHERYVDLIVHGVPDSARR